MGESHSAAENKRADCRLRVRRILNVLWGMPAGGYWEEIRADTTASRQRRTGKEVSAVCEVRFQGERENEPGVGGKPVLTRGLGVSLTATEGTSRGGFGDSALALGKRRYPRPELLAERR